MAGLLAPVMQHVLGHNNLNKEPVCDIRHIVKFEFGSRSDNRLVGTGLFNAAR